MRFAVCAFARISATGCANGGAVENQWPPGVEHSHTHKRDVRLRQRKMHKSCTCLRAPAAAGQLLRILLRFACPAPGAFLALAASTLFLAGLCNRSWCCAVCCSTWHGLQSGQCSRGRVGSGGMCMRGFVCGENSRNLRSRVFLRVCFVFVK